MNWKAWKVLATVNILIFHNTIQSELKGWFETVRWWYYDGCRHPGILRQPGPLHRDREGYEGNNSDIFCSVGESIYYKQNSNHKSASINYFNTIMNHILIKLKKNVHYCFKSGTDLICPKGYTIGTHNTHVTMNLQMLILQLFRWTTRQCWRRAAILPTFSTSSPLWSRNRLTRTAGKLLVVIVYAMLISDF